MLHAYFIQPVYLFQFSSVTQSCLTLCNPMNRSMPGLPVHHQLPESTQTHVHSVGDAIQPSQPLLSPSPPAPNPSQHQGLFQWVNSSHEVANYLIELSSVQSLNHVWLFVTPWTAACQASLSISNFQSLLKLISIKSVMPSNHLLLCPPLLLPSIFPSIRVFSKESVFCIRWPSIGVSASSSVLPMNMQD